MLMIFWFGIWENDRLGFILIVKEFWYLLGHGVISGISS